MNFVLPARFDENNLKVIGEIGLLADETDLILDFTRVNFVFPFPTLAIAVALLGLLEKRRASGLDTSTIGTDYTFGAISYLKFFGFFEALGLPAGNPPAQARENDRYLPITVITRQELESASENQPFQLEIDRQSDRLASVIFPGEENAGPVIMLSYCLREIIRNAFEHADVDECFVMAQRWSDGVAEITIADRGMGIFQSLSRQHNVAEPADAIKLALLPGITSGANRATGSPWDNSGFGLYVTSELGKQFGSFSILSSSTLLQCESGREAIFDIQCTGTIVKLRISTSDGEYFPNILNGIVSEGERIAMATHGVVKSASKMTKSLLGNS